MMRRLFALVTAMLLAAAVQAAPLTLTADMPHASLEGRLEHFADASDNMSFETVRQQNFTLLRDFRSQGYDSATHWYRFELSRTGDAPEHRILAIGKAYLDDVAVWVELPEGGFRQYTLGSHQPNEARPLQIDPLAAPIEVSRRTSIYFRVHTTGAVNVSAEIWQPDAFFARQNRDARYIGVHFGILLIAMLLYLILGAWLRDVIMTAYAGYIASQVLMIHRDLLEQLTSDAPWFDNALMSIGWIGGAVCIVLMWDRLLELKRNYPRIHRLYQFTLFFNIALVPVVLTPFLVERTYLYFVPVANFLSMLIAVINMGLVLIHWRRSRRAELMVYFFAFIIPALATLINVAANRGVLSQNTLTSNLYLLAPLAHVLVMSFGLALRLRQMQHDKAAAEQGVIVAAQRSEEQQRFVAMLSHEFRNPLAAIDRSAQMIAIKTPELATPEARRLKQIRGNVSTLSGLVDNFLLTEALEHHKTVALSREPCTLRPLLEGAVQMQRDDVGERIVLTVTPPDASFTLDPTLIGMAVGNLVGNALRYSPPDSPVEISATVDATGLRIRVADRGAGMSEDELAKLGQPYYRAGSSLGKKGSGLGFYFTRHIVEAHGGSLQASARSGGGVVIEICLS